MDDIEWSIGKWTVEMHLPHDIRLQDDKVYLSLKSSVDDINWSDSRRVDCVDAYQIVGWYILSTIQNHRG